MSSPSREFFTVDLRGLRAGLRSRAARSGQTESAVLRSVVAAAFGTERTDPDPPLVGASDPAMVGHVKVSVRLVKVAACRLHHDARSAGLSRGVYLARLIDGAPPVVASSDRAAMFSALNASSTELALLSRDISHLTQLLRQGSVAAARDYAARHEAMDGIVRAHLALAAPVLAELSAMRLAR
jgi:hypothetical protein